jgi:hypothetical protein
MRKPILEVRVSENWLGANGNEIDLDSSFFYAGIVGNVSEEGDVALELKYRNRDADLLENESERIYDLIKKTSLEDCINVCPCPEGVEYPTIALAGDFDAVVYS